MKDIYQDTTLISGGSADYRVKRSYNRMRYSHWALKHITLKYI